jgi:K+-sensing histidine kinase KdpD
LTTLEFESICQANPQSWIDLKAGLQSWYLLFNAVKLTPAGGVIGIGNRFAKVRVKIDIANSGWESRRMICHMFCAFKLQQHHNATGLELGLYIERRILELHVGTLSVRSKRREQRRCLRFGCPYDTLG